MDRQLAGARAEQIAAHADVVAEIEQLVQGETFFAHEVELHVDLQPLAALLQVGKAGLALETYRHDASGDLYRNARIFQLLSRLFAVFGQYLRHRMSKGELVGIGLLAQGFNISQLLLPQLINAIFK